MYWLDTAILTALALGAGLGLMNGFLWQVARMLSLGLAVAGTVLANGMESLLVLIPEESKENLRQTLAGVGELFSQPARAADPKAKNAR